MLPLATKMRLGSDATTEAAAGRLMLDAPVFDRNYSALCRWSFATNPVAQCQDLRTQATRTTALEQYLK